MIRYRGSVLIFALAGFILILMYLSRGTQDLRSPINDMYKTVLHNYIPLLHIPSLPTGSKTILWYFPPRYLSEDMNGLRPLNTCPNLKCFTTRNRTLLPVSDAVIFSAEHIKGDPPLRKPGQVWVFHNNEPPYLFAYNRPFLKQPWSSAFNWTMDFRHDADIVRPYAVLRNKTRSSVRNYTAVVEMKAGLVAIMVSNCVNWSGRLEYAQELNKWIPVDIFGSCGLDMFPRDKNREWLKYLNSTYKFYLGFENLYCKDYISEKFFNNFNLDLVTVPRGGGNYSRDVPPGTYINTGDFNSPKDLAAYLLHLHQNNDEYIEILKKKDMYYYEAEEYLYTDPSGKPFMEHYHEKESLCEICRRLSNIESHSKMIPDIVPWFERGICEGASPESFHVLICIFVFAILVLPVLVMVKTVKIHSHRLCFSTRSWLNRDDN